MRIAIEGRPVEQTEADAVIIPVFEDPPESRFGAPELTASGEITGKALELTLLHHPPGMKAARVLLAGAGKRAAFDSAAMRKLTGAAVRLLKAKGIKNVVVAPPEGCTDIEYTSAAVEGAILGDFENDRYQTANNKKNIESFAVAGTAHGMAEAAERGRVLAESQNLARTLVNEPANRLPPSGIAKTAQEMAAEFGLEYEALDRAAMEKLGMGSLLGVAQGSAEPPFLIVLRYRPAVASSPSHLGLVGKGVTFDTGGISIKPADGMEKMKYDMAGGAAMIGAMRAIAQLKPNLRVIGIVCASENMPSGKAQKPGAIQIAMSGKSIEVINTDAEGRLVLADGLHYAKQLGATHLIDAATLTGAVVVALGMVNAGVFTNDDSMWEGFQSALKRAGEKMWRLPIDQEYQELIKSQIADIKNTGGRWGGAISAAMFLKEFVDETPWMHLDIAGTAWEEENKAWIAKGPSGIAVRSIVEFVRGFSNSPS